MSHLMVVNLLGRIEGVESQTPENVVSHGECPRVSLPNARPANTVPRDHHASLKVWAAIVSTTPFWTGEPQRWARGEGKESRVKMWLCVIPYVCTTLDRHTERWEGLFLKVIISHTCCPSPTSTPTPRQSQPEEKDCSKELKQENTYWSFISDAINQIHNPESIRVGTSKKANCVRDSYSEQNLLRGPASGWLCRASTAEATTSLRDVSPSGTHMLLQVLLFST